MLFELNLKTESIALCRPAEPLCMEGPVTLREALPLLRDRKRSAILVCDQGKLIGIFTERDALRRMAQSASVDVTLEEVMTPDPVTLRDSDTVEAAIVKMAQGGYRRLPIVDDDHRPTGMLRVGDVMNYLVDHFPAAILNLPPQPHHSPLSIDGG